jgi:Fuc2NAc and GlcNAc transferase
MTHDLVTNPTTLLFISVVLSFGLTGVFTRYAGKRGMLDIPAERHSHTVPTPRGGGAGLVTALVLLSWLYCRDSGAMAFWSHCALPGFVALSVVGWWDDRVSLSPVWRFIVQVLASSYMLWCGVSEGLHSAPLTALLLGVSLVWMTNLFNFMDGSNGMAGFQGVFCGLILGWLFARGGDEDAALVAFLLAAACLGFLPWNLGQARVFMGDVAGGSLGFAIASLLVYGVLKGSMSMPVAWLVMLVFLMDATLTLLARVIKGERWYNPHKQHLYQRLIARGWTHGRVLMLYQLINLVLVMPAIAVAVNYPALAMLVASFLTLALALGWFWARKELGVLASAG